MVAYSHLSLNPAMGLSFSQEMTRARVVCLWWKEEVVCMSSDIHQGCTDKEKTCHNWKCRAKYVTSQVFSRTSFDFLHPMTAQRKQDSKTNKIKIGHWPATGVIHMWLQTLQQPSEKEPSGSSNQELRTLNLINKKKTYLNQTKFILFSCIILSGCKYQRRSSHVVWCSSCHSPDWAA